MMLGMLCKVVFPIYRRRTNKEEEEEEEERTTEEKADFV